MRTARIERITSETNISLELSLDGTGTSEISTGLGFFDHMLTALAKHSWINLKLKAIGDLHIDDHHTVEDVAICLGQALNVALAPRAGITRFGSAYAPLDESLARAVIDFSGRAHATVELALQRDTIGSVAAENLSHFFVSLAENSRSTIHIDVLRGSNDHHRAEAAFKAYALALKQAVSLSGDSAIPSTKGVL